MLTWQNAGVYLIQLASAGKLQVLSDGYVVANTCFRQEQSTSFLLLPTLNYGGLC
jgi:hypothetical protein